MGNLGNLGSGCGGLSSHRSVYTKEIMSAGFCCCWRYCGAGCVLDSDVWADIFKSFVESKVRQLFNFSKFC